MHMDELEGHVDRITFQNEENGFTVAKIKVSNAVDLICVVGLMPALQPGESIRAEGEWKVNPQFGRQFDVSKYRVEAPSDIIGIQKYLESGLIKGIGPVYAKKIIKVFGIETLNVIESETDRLKEIPGIGAKRIEQIRTCWKEQHAVRDIMIFLQGFGITPAFAQKIFKAYRSKSIEKVKENPYNLSRDIHGIGFKMSDRIAQSMGIAQDSDERIDAGVEHVLKELSGDGHACYPVHEFLPIAHEILEVDPEKVASRLEGLELENRIVIASIIHQGDDTPFIWLKPLYSSETGIGREVQRLRTAPSTLRQIDTDKAIEWVQEQLKITLAPLQEKAVSLAVKEKFLIITGGPGTGKSTITNAILTITGFLSSRILLAAPTGRAAKRMAEITGREAKTIHSLLEFDFRIMGFKKNRDNPLECDLLIIDEASMIDTFLMYSLVKAIPNEARIVFVGDIDQLPSVGPGNVLRDLINCKRLPVVMLKDIFRQAAGSAITTNAHKINSGHFPDIRNGFNSDFYFITREEKEHVLETIINLVSSRLPKKYGFKPLEDIQVLAPMKRGLIGTENLNNVLQSILNPQGEGIQRNGFRFLVGDKVMQIRNNYRKEVFNGDVGRIIEVNTSDMQIMVRFGEIDVDYEWKELDELMLAYAVSVHKFQGSECPCVVMPVHTSHFKLLHRNLLYTGVTRGKKLVVLVGNRKALAIAVRNNEVQKRYTALQQSLLAMATTTT
ncbi:MAG: exodeoxyribonuclease V alpha subunit [Chlamydiales bacterium]